MTALTGDQRFVEIKAQTDKGKLGKWVFEEEHQTEMSCFYMLKPLDV